MKYSLRGILCVIAIFAVTAVVMTTRGQVNTGAGDDDLVRPMIPTADRYASGRIFLERADRLLKPGANVEYQVLTGNVMFRRGDMYMYCDSAHFYDATSSLEAYGNVKMEQGDTLFVYGDELQYSDSTQLAVLYADPGKKVRLINRDVELRTDIFNYDMSIELGYYEVGGELIDKQNRLTSIYGEYAPNTKDAIFRNKVHLSSLSKNDTLNIYTEALHYNTDNHIANLDDVSTIISKDGTIYTDNGVYNTETSVADLYSRSLVVTKTGKTLTGDTLFYDRNAGYGEAWGSMVLDDTVKKSKLLGDYGFYNELTDSAFVTGRALAVDYSTADSLSFHGDTIQAFRVITTIEKKPEPQKQLPVVVDTLAIDSVVVDTLAIDSVVVDTLAIDSVAVAIDSVAVDAIAVDTVAVYIEPVDTIAVVAVDTVAVDTLAVLTPALEMPEVDTLVSVPDSMRLMKPELTNLITVSDTTHYIVAYPNVRFYRTDLQGVCDSMTFVQRDSLLHMDIDPVVWSGDRQIFGKKIIVHVNDSTADRVTLPNDAFMAEMLEEGYYNQMSGREMVATLANSTIKHLDVSGNVMLIFYPMEEDSTYNKVANAESSFLSADFDKGQIARLKMWPQSTKVLTPLYMAKKSLFFLKDFKWIPDRRPTGHDDLLTQPKAEATEPSESTEETEAGEPTQEQLPEPSDEQMPESSTEPDDNGKVAEPETKQE